MTLVKCNHCKKETTNDTGECKWCSKELDKNLEDISYKFEEITSAKAKWTKEMKLEIKLIKAKKRKLKVIEFIILLLLVFVIKPPAIAYLLLMVFHFIANKIISKNKFMSKDLS